MSVLSTFQADQLKRVLAIKRKMEFVKKDSLCPEPLKRQMLEGMQAEIVAIYEEKPPGSVPDLLPAAGAEPVRKK